MLEPVWFHFAGSAPVLLRNEVEETIRSAGVPGDHVEFYVDLLCDLGFLGIESGSGFRYPRDEAEREVLREVSKQVARRRSPPTVECYRINTAFHEVLQVR
jgi:hypothetical protein